MRNWFDRLRMNLSRCMYGRNGQDELGFAAFIAGTVVYVIGGIAGNRVVLFIGLLLLGYVIFRMLSRNIEKRRRENAFFHDIIKRPGRYVKLLKLSREYRHTHRYFMCSRCGRIVRVPKGHGRIEITCPGCSNRFIKKT